MRLTITDFDASQLVAALHDAVLYHAHKRVDARHALAEEARTRSEK